jgi:hypothetical protein
MEETLWTRWKAGPAMVVNEEAGQTRKFGKAIFAFIINENIFNKLRKARNIKRNASRFPV